MKILIVEPYFTGSHEAWAREYSEQSSHSVEILGLPGRHWKWRMHGGAVSLARKFLDGSSAPDLIVASDMLDLGTFEALTRSRTAGVRTAVYFHENQISYPWPEDDPDLPRGRDAHYGFINYVSALAADAVLFNSRYHLDSFFGKLGSFLEAFPDHNERDTVRIIREKASVLPLGIDLARFDRHRTERDPAAPPLVLWNHRWEYDKNPREFFEALYALAGEGLAFEVAVLGERFSEEPPVFDEAKDRLGGRIVHFGFVKDFGGYASWLWKADVLPVTSHHDFFGASVVQGIYCNCYPLLPRRLAYPEHIPGERWGEFFYDDRGDLMRRLRERIIRIGETRTTVTGDFVERYDWRQMAPRYDEFFNKLCR
jgi:glycosyltransferase involved in cell wall biosynthesis